MFRTTSLLLAAVLSCTLAQAQNCDVLNEDFENVPAGTLLSTVGWINVTGTIPPRVIGPDNAAIFTTLSFVSATRPFPSDLEGFFSLTFEHFATNTQSVASLLCTNFTPVLQVQFTADPTVSVTTITDLVSGVATLSMLDTQSVVIDGEVGVQYSMSINGVVFVQNAPWPAGGCTAIRALRIDGAMSTPTSAAFDVDNICVSETLGVNYCDVEDNSTGLPGQIMASGSIVALNNTMTLSVAQLPSQSLHFYIVSRTQGFMPNIMGSMGNLCLGGGVGRYVGPGQVMNATVAGTGSLTIDLTSTPQPNTTVSILASETWNWQCWYRDQAPSGAATSNFTPGLSVMFL